jgi:uncharacterized protein involved in outer membrane biogenesis
VNWKRLLLALVFIPLILVLLAFLAALVFENKIKQQVIVEVNKELTVPVKVGGEITLSFLRHFPDASLQFKSVSIANKLKSKEPELAAVQELSFIFSLVELVKGDIHIHKLLLQNGTVNIFKNKQGETNLDILKHNDSKGQGVSLALNKLTLQNVRFNYVDEGTNFDAKARVRKVELVGDFGKPEYKLTSDGNFFIESVKQASDSYVANKQILIAMQLDVKDDGKRILVQKGSVEIEKIPFFVSGSLMFEKHNTLIDMKAQSEGDNISNFISLMPASVKNQLKDFEGKGAYNIQAKLNGVHNKTTSPTVKVVANLNDGVIKLSKYGRELNRVFVKLEYGMDANGSDYLRVSDFRSRISNQPFQFSLLLKNLAQPDFIFDANGVLHLEELDPFIPDSVMKDLKGTVRFTDFSLHGNVADLKDVSNMTLKGGGDFQLEQVSFMAQQVLYEKINGAIHYSGRNLEVKKMTISLLNSEAVFSGTISNLLQYIAALVERKPMNDIALHIDGKLDVKALQLSQMIETFDKQSSEKASVKKKLDVQDVFRINGTLQIAIQKFTFNKMEFDDVVASVSCSPLHLRLNNFSTNTMGGSVKGNGYLAFAGTRDLLMNLGAELTDIDVTKVFEQTENFGQQTLTDKNLQGVLNAKLYVKNVWKNYSSPDLDNLNAIIDFELKNGALKNFEPVKAASAFIRVEELSNIRFADIKNRLTIFNRTVTIPAFEIQTNALNLMFSGQHQFDNVIDYRFKVNLRKMLANKFNRKGREQFIENDPYEGLNIYLSIVGPLSKPKIQYDKATAATKIKADFKNEKEVLKELFKKGGAVKDDKREDKFFQIEEEPKFMEFEEN